MKTLQTLLSSNQKHNDSQMYRSWCLLVINTTAACCRASQKVPPETQQYVMNQYVQSGTSVINIQMWDSDCDVKKKKKRGEIQSVSSSNITN